MADEYDEIALRVLEALECGTQAEDEYRTPIIAEAFRAAAKAKTCLTCAHWGNKAHGNRRDCEHPKFPALIEIVSTPPDFSCALYQAAGTERTDRPCRTFWMSFVSDEDKFLGVILVDAENESMAMLAVNLARINPGGEVAIVELPPLAEVDDPDAAATYALPRLMLLSKADLEQRIAIVRSGDMDAGDRATFEAKVTRVCSDYN